MAGIECLYTKSPVHKLDPRVKIIAFLLYSIFIFTTKSFIVISLVFFPVVSLWFIAKIPFSRIAGLIKLMIGLMAMITAMQALFQDGTTILVQPIIPNFIPLIGGVGTIYWEGVEYGLILSYRLITLILIMPLFLMTTDVNSMSVGLVKLGLPYKFAYMASTALNMIPSLTEQVNTIMDAQKLRGSMVFEEGKMMDKIKAYPALVVPMVIGAMKKSMLVGIAMDARAFGCDKKRTYVQVLTYSKSDIAALVGIIVYLLALIVLNFFGLKYLGL